MRYYTILILYYTILYYTISHGIENTANQKARKPLHILRYATGSIPRKILAFLAAYYLLLKGVYTFNEQFLFIYFIYFYQNYVLSRNVANLLNIFSLIVFAVKALKSDVLC